MSSISDYIKYQGKYLCYQLTPTNRIKLILTNNKLKPIINKLNEEYPKYKGSFIIVKMVIDKSNKKSVISAEIKLYVNNNGSYIDFDEIEDDDLFNKYEPLSRMFNLIVYFSDSFLIKYGWSYKYINDILKKIINGLKLNIIRFPFYDKDVLDKTPKVQKMVFEPILKETKKKIKNKDPILIVKKNIKDEGLLYGYRVRNNKMKLLYIGNSIRKTIKSIEELYKDKKNKTDMIVISNINFFTKDSGFPSSVSVTNDFYLFDSPSGVYSSGYKDKLIKIDKFKNREGREYFNNYRDTYQKLTLPIFFPDDYLIEKGWSNEYISKGYNKLLQKEYKADKKKGWHIYNKI